MRLEKSSYWRAILLSQGFFLHFFRCMPELITHEDLAALADKLTTNITENIKSYVDLRFNEMDTKLEATEQRLSFKITSEISASEQRMEAKMEARDIRMNKRFDQQDKRFDQQDERFNQQDKRFDQQDKRFDQQDERFENFVELFTKKHHEIVTHLAKIDGRLVMIEHQMWGDKRFPEIEKRIITLAERTGSPDLATPFWTPWHFVDKPQDG